MRRHRTFTIAVLCLFGHSAGLGAQTAMWLSPADGLWSESSRWSTDPFYPNNGSPPGTSYDVSIDVAGTPYVVDFGPGIGADGVAVNHVGLSSADAILHVRSNSLQSLNGLSLSAGTLDLNGGIVRDTTIRGTGGTAILRSGILRNVTLERGALIASDSQLVSAPVLFIEDGLTLQQTSLVATNEPLFTRLGLRGTQAIRGTGMIDLGTRIPRFHVTDGTLTIEPGITIVNGDWLYSGARVVNYGSIRPTRNTSFVGSIAGALLINRGIIEAGTGVRIDLEGQIDNRNGIVRANGGHIRIGNSSLGAAPLTTAQLGSMQAFGGGSIELLGRIINTGATLVADEVTGPLRLSATIEGGTLSAVNGAYFEDGEFVGVTLAAPLIAMRTVAVRDGLSLMDASITLNSAGLLLDSISGDGTITINGTSDTSTLIGAYPGSPSIQFGAGVVLKTGTTGARLGTHNYDTHMAGTVLADAPQRTLHASRLINSGTLHASNQSRIQILGMANSGMVHADGGTVVIRDEWSNVGSLKASNGGRLELHTLPDKLGTISLDQGTLAFNGTLTTQALQGIPSSNATIAIMQQGVLDNTASQFALGANSSIQLEGGTIRGGTISGPASSVLTVAPPMSGTLDGVVIAVPVVVEGGAVLGAVSPLSLLDATVHLTAGSLSLNGQQGTLSGSGEVIMNGGWLRGNGIGINIDPAITVRLGQGSGTIQVSNSTVNRGRIIAESTGDELRVTSTLTNLGTVKLANGAALRVRSLTNREVVTVHEASVLVEQQFQNTGTIDLSGHMILDYFATSHFGTIDPQVRTGYAGGAWNGPGINSSSAAANAGFGIGYAESADLFDTFPATFAGRLVDSTAVLMALTRYGDANLDGVVDLADFNRLAANFGQTGRLWVHGDFNYDGIVNLADFNRLAANFGLAAAPDGPTPEDWSALAAAVPEPALAWLLVAAASMGMRRRRR